MTAHGIACPHCAKPLAVETDDGGFLIKARVAVFYPEAGNVRWKCSWCRSESRTAPAFLQVPGQ